jgi:hypothetical protein
MTYVYIACVCDGERFHATECSNDYQMPENSHTHRLRLRHTFLKNCHKNTQDDHEHSQFEGDPGARDAQMTGAGARIGPARRNTSPASVQLECSKLHSTAFNNSSALALSHFTVCLSHAPSRTITNVIAFKALCASCISSSRPVSGRRMEMFSRREIGADSLWKIALNPSSPISLSPS